MCSNLPRTSPSGTPIAPTLGHTRVHVPFYASMECPGWRRAREARAETEGGNIRGSADRKGPPEKIVSEPEYETESEQTAFRIKSWFQTNIPIITSPFLSKKHKMSGNSRAFGTIMKLCCDVETLSSHKETRFNVSVSNTYWDQYKASYLHRLEN